MAGSTIVAVKQALITELSALGGMSAVSLSYAHPGDRGGKEILYCGAVRDGDHEADAVKRTMSLTCRLWCQARS